jgi:hypothetical protein
MKKNACAVCSRSHISSNGGPAGVNGQNINANSFKSICLRVDKRITNQYIMVLKDNVIEMLHGGMKVRTEEKVIARMAACSEVIDDSLRFLTPPTTT